MKDSGTGRDDAAAVSALLEAERIDPGEVQHQAVLRAHRARAAAPASGARRRPVSAGWPSGVGVLASA